ncbi:hypothetical protein D9M68_922280 [compost metagenome]
MEARDRGDIEYLSTALARHHRADGVAQAGKREDIHLDQLLLMAPVLCDEGAGSAHSRVVHQQVYAALTLFQFVQQAR